MGCKHGWSLNVNWTSLKEADRVRLKPQLASTSGWLLLALSTGVKAPQIPPVPGARKLLTTSGKAYRNRRLWKVGDDHLAAYGKELVVRVSGGDAVT